MARANDTMLAATPVADGATERTPSTNASRLSVPSILFAENAWTRAVPSDAIRRLRIFVRQTVERDFLRLECSLEASELIREIAEQHVLEVRERRRRIGLAGDSLEEPGQFRPQANDARPKCRIRSLVETVAAEFLMELAERGNLFGDGNLDSCTIGNRRRVEQERRIGENRLLFLLVVGDVVGRRHHRADDRNLVQFRSDRIGRRQIGSEHVDAPW